MGHEMGHIVERELFNKASTKEKNAIRDAYNKWYEGVGKAKTTHDIIRMSRAKASAEKIMKADPDISLDRVRSLYGFTSFPEWFADNVSKWSVSQKKPVTIIEKFFKKVADALRKLYASVAGKKWLPDKELAKWLDARTVNHALGEDVKIGVNEFAQKLSLSLKQAAKNVMDNPAFRKWFGKSKVVDADGKPLVVYHGTFAEFEAFDRRTRSEVEELGFHFGNRYQAESRMESQATRDAVADGRDYTVYEDYEGARNVPVYLSLQNILKLPDAGVWDASSIATILELKPKQATQLTITQKKKIKEIGYSDKKNKTAILREYLESRGYDPHT
jgi:hypothetical protein